MNPIQEAIEYIESREPGAGFSYREVARKFGVDRMTLTRRHKGQCQPHKIAHFSLHPQHEKELVQYIKSLTERRTPPSRRMIRNFASSLVGREVSESWVTRFINRNSTDLISRWQRAMDRDRHKADSEAKYSLYFELLHDKMREYDVQPSHIFNMDEKGFMLGVLGRSKRVFDKKLYSQKAVTTAVQDGSREWITVLACVSSDGTALSPAIIFQSDSGDLQSSWVDTIDPEKHSVFVSSSPTGWSNNDIGLAWLKEVFERETRRHALTGYRLLLLDGHSSHITMNFIRYCDERKILLAIFPPHATHTLQPLDVGMFKPLSSAYSTQLENYLQDNQNITPMRKGDFFLFFWEAWSTAFKKETIRKSFEATGIHPPNAEVVLQRFRHTDSSSDDSSSSRYSSEDWLKIKTIIDQATDKSNNKAVKKIQRSLHHISSQNSILRAEIRGLRASLLAKKRHQKKRYTLRLSDPKEYHGGAVFWSPKKVRQAQNDEMERQHQAEQLRLQKKERKRQREQAQLDKLQLQKEKRVERERLKVEREAERAEKLAEKERQKAIRNAEKAIQLSQKGKRKASQGSTQKQKRQKLIVVDISRVQAQEAAPAVSSQTTRLGRTTKVPPKYK